MLRAASVVATTSFAAKKCFLLCVLALLLNHVTLTHSQKLHMSKLAHAG